MIPAGRMGWTRSPLVVLAFFTTTATLILLMSTIVSSLREFPNGNIVVAANPILSPKDDAQNPNSNLLYQRHHRQAIFNSSSNTNTRQLTDHRMPTPSNALVFGLVPKRLLSSDSSRQSPVSEKRKYSPAQFPDAEPTASDDYLADDSTTATPSASGGSDRGKSAEKVTSSTNLILVGVVVIFLVAGVIFFCLRNSGSGAGSKDERPLLTLLSMSDSSEGYSKQNLGYGNSSRADMSGLPSFKTVDTAQNGHVPSLNVSLGATTSSPGNVPSFATSSFAQSSAVDDLSSSKPPLPPPPAMVASMRRYGHPMPSFSATLPVAPGHPSPAAPAAIGPISPDTSAAPGPVYPAAHAAIGPVSPDTSAVPGPCLPPPPGGIPKPNPKEPPPEHSQPPPPCVPKAPPTRGPPPPGAGPPGRGPPPPPMKGGSGPRPQPPRGSKKPPALGSTGPGDNSDPKTKLKPFFWDKVNASSDQQMVWHEISSGSFQFNEEMIESLFGLSNTNKGAGKKDSSSTPAAPQAVRILEPKKAQNLSILLKALNVANSEVYEALEEGNELPNELIQTLIKMAPTQEEELKLRLYNDDLANLGVAERFLKRLVEIPFAYKRLRALLFMGSLKEDISGTNESFATVEVACAELKNNRLFLKLLEAVLKTGNRMNDGTYRGGASAFKLDTLLKLADVKGTDGKTTLLHFVVQEIIRSEGMRAARLARQSGSICSINSEELFTADEPPNDSVDHFHSLGVKVVSNLGNELENVKKAAILDVEGLTGTVANLGNELLRTKEFLLKDLKSEQDDSGFYHSLTCFLGHAEISVTTLLQDEKRVRALLKSTTDYFHGNSGGKDEGVRLFGIVRDILGMLEKICREVDKACRDKAAKKPAAAAAKAPVNNTDQTPTSQPVPDPNAQLFPAIKDQRAVCSSSSSDDDS